MNDKKQTPSSVSDRLVSEKKEVNTMSKKQQKPISTDENAGDTSTMQNLTAQEQQLIADFRAGNVNEVIEAVVPKTEPVEPDKPQTSYVWEADLARIREAEAERERLNELRAWAVAGKLISCRFANMDMVKNGEGQLIVDTITDALNDFWQ